MLKYLVTVLEEHGELPIAAEIIRSPRTRAFGKKIGKPTRATDPRRLFRPGACCLEQTGRRSGRASQSTHGPIVGRSAAGFRRQQAKESQLRVLSDKADVA
jgi:hypothetical protein